MIELTEITANNTDIIHPESGREMKKQLLILDDKESIAKIISVFLSDEFDITYFDTPVKGIDWLLEGHIPDLIILDIRMPEMSGDQFLRYIKRNGLFKDIPVIILSGEESSAVRIRMLEEGADDYILKPFNPMELKVRIRKVMK